MGKYILGIETSCDDTAVALVDRDGNVVSAFTNSQVEIHNQYGGVFPELAGRAHVQNIIPTVNNTLKKADITIDDIEAIGVTRGPGLIGSLLVGLNTANALGLAWGKEVIGINHLRGHLRSADLEEKRVEYPAVILLVSGGHTFLSYMENSSDIRLLGSTRDDSVGEAYDKVSRMLGLGYPGGPVVDRTAKTGNPIYPFPRPLLREGLEFSFSGLKSAVSRFLGSDKSEGYKVEDVCASFVESVMEILIHKCKKAIKENPCKSLVVVGGVAASPQLREQTQTICDEMGVKLCLPPIKWSTDNAAMIALAAWDYIDMGVKTKGKAELGLPLNKF